MKILYTFLTFTCFTSIAFAQCDEFTVEVSHADPLCPDYADGSVTAIPSGGTAPYSIFITDEDEFIRNPDGGSETGNLLLKGWYYIDITDDMGCTFSDSVLLVDPLQINLDDYTVIEPSGLEICDGSITINEVSGDYESLFYSWTPDPDGISGMGVNTFTDACPGTYDLVLVNEVGCSMSYEFEIGEGLSVQESKTKICEVYSVSNGVTVVSDLADNSVSLKLYSHDGKELGNYSILLGKNEFLIEHTGFVIYSLIDSSGNILQRNSLIIHH